MENLTTQPFPIARSADVPLRHVYHGQLLGIELAVWRADDGRVNVWENRCAHRGVRLSIACNLGERLQCQYHGWQYASGSGACQFIPAHPEMTPPERIRIRSFEHREAAGLVWVALEGGVVECPHDAPWRPVARIEIEASPQVVMDALETAAFDWFDSGSRVATPMDIVRHQRDAWTFEFSAQAGSKPQQQWRAVLQPMGPGETGLYFLIPGVQNAMRFEIGRRFMFWARCIARDIEMQNKVERRTARTQFSEAAL